MKNYLIIGNGTAAAGAIEGIREKDKTGKITVISEERHSVYSRPLISYLLEGKTDTEKMKYRDRSFYKRNGCRVLYRKKAVSIDAARRRVKLDDKTVIGYDALCVATGSRPFVPPISGLENVKNRFTFTTLDDALAIEKKLSKESRVLIIGAGLIGLKCAEGLHGRVKSITVCDLASRVLSSILDDDCAKIVQSHLEKTGMNFLLGDTASSLEDGRAIMKSGKTVEFDILILALGVRPNSELVKEAGGVTGRAITIDERCKTSLPDIYAAGDCTEGPDSLIGEKRPIAILPNAYFQGHAAGVNMADGDERNDKAIAMNSIGFFGLHLMTAGVYDGEMKEEKEDGSIKRFFIKGNTLRGFILIGKTERAGIYTSLVREKTPLDSIDFELTKKVASNMIFSEEIRRKKFGGVV